MGKRLMSLRNVGDDEADDIRHLLEVNGVEYYETPGSHWGISVPVIWIYDETEYEHAISLLEHYQSNRSKEQKAHYQDIKDKGEQHTLWQEVRQNPSRFTLYLICAMLVLYLSIMPFFEIIVVAD